MISLGVRKSATLCLLAVLVAVSRPAEAGDPYLEWFTVETPHFRVHYHRGLDELAEHTANVAEAVRKRLGEPLGDAPGDLVHILITDDSDAANGAASGVPYNAIRLLATAPDDMSVLGDYDEWSHELVSHEQTHVFHINDISGPAEVLNAVLGKTYAPNSVQPHWILEGLAVAMESEQTSGGRVRSTLFDMYLRADVLEHNLAGLDEMSHDVRRWPGQDIWYLYGGRFYAFILDTYGPDVFAAVATDYGRNPIPWGINRSIRSATGRTYPELYRAWTEGLERGYRAEVDGVRTRGLREGTRLTSAGRIAQNPRFVPACARSGSREELLYYVDDGHRPAGFYRLPLESRTRADESDAELVARTNGAPRVASFGPGCGFVFDSVAPSLRFYDFDDLHYQLLGAQSEGGASRGRERWTRGLRARSPDVSPDGRHVVFVTNHAGTMTLRIADVRPGGGIEKERRLVPSARYEQAYSPRFSPDGRMVAYSAWSRGGYRDVRVVDVATGRFFDVTHDRALDTEPSFSPDGKRVFFSSDRSGISNIYAYDLDTGRLHQVTNVVNGAFMPEVSPDGKTLVYVGYTHAGFDLFSMPLSDSNLLEPEPARQRPDPPTLPAEKQWPVARYNPLPTLRPYAYTVNYATGALGPEVTLGVHGSDIVGHHSFAAGISYYSDLGEVTGSVGYSYSGLPMTLSLSASRTIVPERPLVVDGRSIPLRDDVLSLSTGVSYTLPGEFDSQTVTLAYTASQHDSHVPIGQAVDPFAELLPVPFEGFLGSVHGAWSYSNAFGSLYGVSNERGVSFAASSDFADTATGSDRTLFSVQGRAIGYLLAPWARHHVFALALSGGAATGTFPVSGLFYSGGFADVNALDAAVNGPLQSAFVLRGYPPGAFFGRQYNLANLEYRFPIAIIDRGVSTLPFLLRTLSGTLFSDYGGAYDTLDSKDPLGQYHLGLGAELGVEFTVGYFIDTALRLGWAKGFGDHAVPGIQNYLVAAATF